MRIGIVAGEASGDLLGAGLVEAIRRKTPGAQFRGIAGPRMVAAGVEAVYDAEELSVMGLFEVLGRLPRLLSVRAGLIATMRDWRPDVFVGIDSPDFTLPVERRLRVAGFRTVHYVSPTVWAWRPGRVRTVARAADAVLCLLPFEPARYEGSGTDARFVGHPLATRLQDSPAARLDARRQLGLAEDARVVAVLPGSRDSELRHLGAAMAGAMHQLASSGTVFVAPMASPRLAQRFRGMCAEGLPVTWIEGRSHDAMRAADVVLTASGTAALEAMLLRRPMVVGYRLAPLTAWVLRRFRLLQVGRFSLPNLLAGDELVPELLQERATPDHLADAVSTLLHDPAARAAQVMAFDRLHEVLRGGGDEAAAAAVLEVGR